MNGLRFIRIQCNITISELAMRLGLSRQIISAWENDRKPIANGRKEQLSKYFGIDSKYFGEIGEQEKQEILLKPKYRYGEELDEYYLYRKNENMANNVGGSLTIALSERTTSLSDEFEACKTEFKEVLNQIEKQSWGPKARSIQDQMVRLHRGITYYGFCLDNLNAVYSKEPIKKMFYYYRLLEVMKAVSIAFGVQCDLGEVCDNYTYEEDPDFVKMIASEIEKHMQPMLDEFDKRKTPEYRENAKRAAREYEETRRNMSLEETINSLQKDFDEAKARGAKEFTFVLPESNSNSEKC